MRALQEGRWALRIAVGLLAIVVLAGWNAGVSRTVGANTDPPTDDAEDCGADDRATEGRDPDLVERERNWYDYIRGFHAHYGDAEGDHPEDGSFWSGLERWLDYGCLRGYTLGDCTFVCSNAPRVLRVHQAGHAPSFGRQFEPIRTERRPNGGLDDEPLRTLDVMLPGDFPHTLLRFRDPRKLGETYNAWLREGRIERR